jgi:hypothetical protein
MGITPNFTPADLQRFFDAFLSEIEKQQIRRLQELGEMCVNHARSIPKEQGFEDQTGNLRSSIGYMVFVNGVAIHGEYVTVQPKKPKPGVIYDGAEKGEALAKKVGENTTGVCLVVTAGMDYAIYLEAKGRDVITSAEHLAERELPKMLDELIENTKRTTE